MTGGECCFNLIFFVILMSNCSFEICYILLLYLVFSALLLFGCLATK